MEEEEEGTPTQKHGAAAERLVAAVERATGKPLFGRPRAQLEELSQRANGNLAAMLEAASRPGSAGFTIRIAEIERIASGERESFEAEHAARSDPRRRTWEQALAAARLSGDEELASEAQAALDTMEP